MGRRQSTTKPWQLTETWANWQISRVMYSAQGLYSLTHCGLVTPYGDMELGQHCLRQWLVAWRHQAITWTNVDSYQWGPMTITWWQFHQRYPSHVSLKLAWNVHYLKFHSNIPGINELRRHRHLIGVRIPVINLILSSDSLRFIMGIPISVRRRLFSEYRPSARFLSLS